MNTLDKMGLTRPTKPQPITPRTIGRLGTIADVERALERCKAAGFETTLDLQPGTALACFEAHVAFRALNKGGGVWICLYTRGYWAGME